MNYKDRIIKILELILDSSASLLTPDSNAIIAPESKAAKDIANLLTTDRDYYWDYSENDLDCRIHFKTPQSKLAPFVSITYKRNYISIEPNAIMVEIKEPTSQLKKTLRKVIKTLKNGK